MWGYLNFCSRKPFLITNLPHKLHARLTCAGMFHALAKIYQICKQEGSFLFQDSHQALRLKLCKSGWHLEDLAYRVPIVCNILQAN